MEGFKIKKNVTTVDPDLIQSKVDITDEKKPVRKVSKIKVTFIIIFNQFVEKKLIFTVEIKMPRRC